MTQSDLEFARTYSAMADEELVDLSTESASLVGAAQEALQQEMDRRGLKPGQAVPTVEEALVCPGCGQKATHPLTCGSCAASICRSCGTELHHDWDEGEDDGDGGAQVRRQAAG